MIDFSTLKNKKQGEGFIVGELSAYHPTLQYLKPGTLVGQFDGVNAVLNFLEKYQAEPMRGKSSVSKGGDGGFYKFTTYKEAMDIFMNKPESIVKYDQAELQIKDVNEAGNNVEYDVTGDFIDMGRYLEGVPEVFGSMHMGNARNRRVTIIISLNQWAGMKEKDINHRSERILRLVDALENNGVRCEIRAISSTQCEHCEVIVKQYNESLVISDLAVAMHSEFLRRCMFRFKEYSTTFQSGYGSPIMFTDSITREPSLIETELNDEIAIYIGNDMPGSIIDQRFEQAEAILEWEISKPVPEVGSIIIDKSRLSFHGNGSRDENELIREGKEVAKERA